VDFHVHELFSLRLTNFDLEFFFADEVIVDYWP
jgi:hypothetical protein